MGSVVTDDPTGNQDSSVDQKIRLIRVLAQQPGTIDQINKKIEEILKEAGEELLTNENYIKQYNKLFRQKEVPRLLKQAPNLVFICGRYEGFDERIWHYIDEQISLGDFITMGGEIPALVMTEVLIRALPGAIQPNSYQQETTTSQLDFASYTWPAEYEGLKVPEVLLSGDHAKIDQ